MSTLVLGFDASTPRCVIVVGRIDDTGSELLAWDDEEDAPNQASARLLERIGAVMDQAGVDPGQLGAVACGRGPGTFTGVRVALATAKGIAVGSGVPILPVSSLDALALSAGTEGLVLPLLDARRQEVYGSLVHCQHSPAPAVEARTQERVAALETVLQDARPHVGDAAVVAVGSGAEVYRDRLPEDWRTDSGLRGPTPQGLFAAIGAAHRAGAVVDPGLAEATYLRKSYAELGINKPKRPFVKSPFV